VGFRFGSIAGDRSSTVIFCLNQAKKNMSTDLDILKDVSTEEYKYGFTTDIEMDFAPKGLNEDTIRFISAKKNEPEWLLEWRLKAYRHFEKMEWPTWQNFELPKMDLQGISYYAAEQPG
jgi:Fe-S cluster assembly protein SufB